MQTVLGFQEKPHVCTKRNNKKIYHLTGKIDIAFMLSFLLLSLEKQRSRKETIQTTPCILYPQTKARNRIHMLHDTCYLHTQRDADCSTRKNILNCKWAKHHHATISGLSMLDLISSLKNDHVLNPCTLANCGMPPGDVAESLTPDLTAQPGPIATTGLIRHLSMTLAVLCTKTFPTMWWSTAHCEDDFFCREP